MGIVIHVDSLEAKLQGVVSRGVKEAEVNESGHLIFTLTDDSTIDLGSVIGPQGPQGIQGPVGPQGYRVASVYKKSGTGAAGTIDVYGMAINDTAQTEVGTFNVYNGADGAGAGDMVKAVYDPANGARQVAFANELPTSQEKTAWNAKYDKPSGGIPKTDMTSAVQASLNLADSALQAAALTPYRTAAAQDVIDAGKAATSHAHGNITSDGKIGSASLDNTLVHLVNNSLQTLAGTDVSTGARMEFGSYVGTGTYGESYPNSLTFDFAPKMVFIWNTNGSEGFGVSGAPYSSSTELLTKTVMIASQLSTEYVNGKGFGCQFGSYYNYGKKSADGKTFYWYINPFSATDVSSQQFNSSSYTYGYLAIG